MGCPRVFCLLGQMHVATLRSTTWAARGVCIIEHPDYARRTLDHVPFDKQAELKLSRGGVVEGQVIDTVTGQPVGGLSVSIQPINGTVRIENGKLRIDEAGYFGASTTTDSRGRYQHRLDSDRKIQCHCVQRAGTRLGRSRFVGSLRRTGRAGAPDSPRQTGCREGSSD